MNSIFNSIQLANVICIEVPESFVHHIQPNNMIIIYQSDRQEYVEIHSFKVVWL